MRKEAEENEARLRAQEELERAQRAEISVDVVEKTID